MATTTKTNDIDFLDKPMSAANKTAPKWQQKTPAKYVKPDECLGCPLYNLSSGFSKPEGRGTVPLLIVAEALGEQECKDGLPLRPYAPSGSVIEKAIKDAGYTREQFVLTNVLSCRPPNNELEGAWYERGAIEHCRVHFDNVVTRYQPKAILALGNVPLAALTGLSGKDRTVSSLRGYVLWSDRYNLPVVPSYHPSFVRRGGLKLLWVLRHDLQKAAAVAQGKFSNYVIAQTPEDIRYKTDLMYQVEPNAAALESWFRYLQDRPETFFSYDIETAYTANQDEDEREIKGREITQIQFSQAVGEGIALKWGQEAAEFSKAVFALDNPRGNQNCFYKNTSVWMADGSWKTIHTVKVGEKVKSLAEDGEIINAVVVDTPRTKDDRPWVEVVVDGAYNRGVGRWGNTGVVCTPEHNWMVKGRGWTKAEDLIHGEEVFLPRSGSEDLLFGSMLGDGHAKANENRFSCGHNLKAYAEAKAEGLGVKLCEQIHTGGYKEEATTYFFSLAVPAYWRKKFYNSDGSRNWHPPISDKALAIWYGDDGGISSDKKHPTISLHKYPKQIEEIRAWFVKEFGAASIHNEAVIYLPLSAASKFFERVANWLPTPVGYKLPEKYQGRYNNWLRLSMAQVGRVVEVKRFVSNPLYAENKYCLGVAGTNNFFTRAGLVSNCWRFDNKILRLNGIEAAPVPSKNLDTMIMWHHYQPDLPQKLQFVASFFGMPFPWKHFVTQDFGMYGICDVDAVQRIYEKLPEVMKRKVNKETGVNLWDSYMDKVVNLQPILEGMQTRGIGVDVKGQAKLREWVAAEQERVNTELQVLIPAEVKKRKEWKTWPSELRELAKQWAQQRLEQEKQAALVDIDPTVKGLVKVALKGIKLRPFKIADVTREHLLDITKLGYVWDNTILYKELDYNPNSTFQLRDLLKHFKVDIPVSVDGAETTGKGELRKLLKKSKVGEVIPIVMKTLEYRELGKTIGTYIDGKGWTPDAEGRVHTTFTFKSATWQLTSIEPNIQNCFPPEVEILTDWGWKRFDELTNSHLVAQYDKTTGVITLVPPTKRIKESFTGELVHISTEEQLDMIMTPDHECLVQHRKTGEWKKVPASEYPSDYKQIQAGFYTGGSFTKFSKDQLILCAALQADGCINTSGGIAWGFHKARKKDRLEKALTALGLKFSYHEGPKSKDNPTIAYKYYIGAGEVPTWLRDKKFFSRWVLGLDEEMFEFLADEIYFWDGSSTRMSMYSSNIKSNTDWAQVLAVLTGRRAKIREYETSAGNINYQTDVSSKPYSLSSNRAIERVPYSGFVYCVTVPTGNIVTRYNGKVAITGNCPKHTRLGGEIRKLIVPKPGNVLLEADYSSFHVLTLGFNAESKAYMDLARSDAHSYVCAQMLKTRIKENTKDECEVDTLRHIQDLDSWLSLPREKFLAKLAWVKKQYGKTLRQQAKAGILGVGLGLGVDKLHAHNEDSFNPSESQAEQWLASNNKVQFYSPIAKAMKPASYFPKEMQVMLAQEKLGKAAAKELRSLLERLFPEVFRWQQKIRAQAHRDGYLVSRYGGIRWFHNVFEWNAQRGMEVPGEDAEAAIAFFVQNDAFGKIREAMLEISRETGWGEYMVNTVHDSLVFDIPEAYQYKIGKDIKHIMERPAKLLKHPVLCPEGLACNVEISIGPNWHELKEVKL